MYGLIFADDCVYGDIRLVNGEFEMEGRVEICNNRRWGTVCDSQWTDNHTAVVCRQLGFSDIIGGRLKDSILYNTQVTSFTAHPTLESTYFRSEKFGKGSGPVLMDYVNCTGSESRLWRLSQRLHIDCLSYTHYYGCSHSNDIGVRCQPGIMYNYFTVTVNIISLFLLCV